MKRHASIFLLLAALAACGSPDATGSADSGDNSPDAGTRPAPDTDSPAPDSGHTEPDAAPDLGHEPASYAVPPRRWEPTVSLTHDVDADLVAVLELDRVSDACVRWNEGARDEETKMLCGKYMFFWETFGTVGIPRDLLKFAQDYYADYYGVGFEKFGFVADPTSDTGMPIGLVASSGTLGDDIETNAFTCASCHFGKMADGRYAAGFGNLNLDYGRFIGGLGAPLTMSLNENSSDIHPDIRAELLPYVRAAKMQPGYTFAAAGVGLGLLSAGDTGRVTVDEQAQFWGLLPGTMDFLTKPLVDDGVWTVSRILSLWNIPTPAMRAEAGMEHEMLSWTGGATNLDSFISGFVAIGVADPAAWPAERTEPLEAYIRSLRTPPLLATLNPESVERGAAAFVEHGCADCHIGPSGEGNRAFAYTEVGTDDAMLGIFGVDENGELCCGFGEGDEGGYIVTNGVKAPRMTGIENQTSYLHNGAVPSLSSLLCLEARPDVATPAQTAVGHTYGCDLDDATRVDLIEYLRSL